MTLDYSPQQPIRNNLILVITEIVMAVVIAGRMIIKTTQTRAIIMKMNLTLLDLKTLFYMMAMTN